MSFDLFGTSDLLLTGAYYSVPYIGVKHIYGQAGGIVPRAEENSTEYVMGLTDQEAGAEEKRSGPFASRPDRGKGLRIALGLTINSDGEYIGAGVAVLPDGLAPPDSIKSVDGCGA